jgi:hypothetical protein
MLPLALPARWNGNDETDHTGRNSGFLGRSHGSLDEVFSAKNQIGDNGETKP